MRNNLLKDTFSLLLNTNLIKSIAPSFLLLLGTTSLLSSFNEFFYLLAAIGGLLLFPISMTILRFHEESQSIKFPEIKIILKKSLKIFVAELVSSLIVFIGFLCLFVPGIILAKRYIYVGIICEEQMTGPLDSMRKSADLSRNNGWRVILNGIVIGILFIILCLPISLILIMNEGNIFLEFICNLPYLWLVYIGSNMFIFTAYRQALNMNRSSYLK